MKIYFAGAVRGGREDAGLYLRIIKHLSEYGLVLTEHLGDVMLDERGEPGLSDADIHDRDLAWLRQAECLVAEVTAPSLGVGYEIGKLRSGANQFFVSFDRRRDECCQR